MKALYEAYKDKAIILVIYIREAHPANADQTAQDAGWKAIEDTVFYQPTTFAQRRKLAETACTFWDLPIPALIDTMQPSIGETYQAFPNRVYLINTEGKIVYRGVKGPRGVNVHESELELRKLLGITDGKPVTEPPKQRVAPSGRGRLGSRRGADTADELKNESDVEDRTNSGPDATSDKSDETPAAKQSGDPAKKTDGSRDRA